MIRSFGMLRRVASVLGEAAERTQGTGDALSEMKKKLKVPPGSSNGKGGRGKGRRSSPFPRSSSCFPSLSPPKRKLTSVRGRP